jgi:hypothetical protein
MRASMKDLPSMMTGYVSDEEDMAMGIERHIPAYIFVLRQHEHDKQDSDTNDHSSGSLFKPSVDMAGTLNMDRIDRSGPNRRLAVQVVHAPRLYDTNKIIRSLTPSPPIPEVSESRHAACIP